MRSFRSKGVTAAVVFVGVISAGLVGAWPAGALFQPETTITDAPGSPTSSTVASFSFESSLMGSTFECQIDGLGWDGCSSPKVYTNLGDGSHTFEVQATDPIFPPTTDPTPATHTWTVDTAGPSTSITAGPSGTTNQAAVHFEFSAPGAASYECDRDGNGFNPCSSPQDYTVGDGAHSFSVRAIDSLGNTGPTATRNWSVDTTGPTTSISAGPSGTTNQTAIHFEFSAPGAASYECDRDGAGFSPCNSPEDYNVGEGAHSFSVRATDSLGNTGPTATRNWVVDTTGPTASITAGPSGTSSQTTAHFEFSAPGAASYECDRDGAGFSPCNSPEDYNVGEGAHSFSVRATDSLGNTGPTATRNWVVDTTGPTASITSGPSGTTSQTTAHFEFSAPGAASYECDRDGAGFSPCNSPQDYTVGEGVHTFSVRALDSVGNTGPTATRTWTVDTTGPTTTINNGPSGTTNQTAAHFEFSAPGAASYECDRDGAGFSPCNSPQDYTVGEGVHTFSVRALDSVGNTGPTATRTWTVDTTGPTTTINNGPSGTTNQTAVHFEFSAPGAASYQCNRDGAGFNPCNSPEDYTVGEGTHSFSVRATDSLGNVGPVVTRNWTVITTGPTTSITVGPSGTTNQTAVHFEFSAAGAVSYECNRDGAGFNPCSSPDEYTVGSGAHSFSVRATDGLGNTGPPTARNWTVDTTGPAVTITGGPSGTVTTSAASFSFSSSATDLARFECSVDFVGFSTCGSPANYAVGDGPHAFQVRGVDNVGNPGPVVTRNWTVDTSPPDVSITSGPPPVTSSTSASFSFTSTATDLAGFECRIDGGNFSSCSSPQSYNSLSATSHTFQVRSVDSAGNFSTPATRSWTIDTGAPDVTITGGPSGPTNQTTASFTFHSNASDIARYECRVDAEPAFTPCSSPANYGVGAGAHTFRVQAVDTAGNVSTVATRSWTVDVTPPETNVNSGPQQPVTSSNEATFIYSSSESGSGFQCHLDNADWGVCPSSPASITYSGVSDGTHTFYVRAIDAAGNVDQSEASYTWNVLTTEPETTITSGPSGTVAQNIAQFGFASEQGATFQCQLAGPGQSGGFVSCGSPVTYASLANGNYTFSVRARNIAGTFDSTPATRSFSVDTTGPTSTIDSGPPTPTNLATVAFGFSANEAGSTFRCSMDTPTIADFTPCTSPASYPLGDGQQDGQHIFRVFAVDPVGNAGPVASRSVVIDTVPPDTTITSQPLGTTANGQPTFTFNGTGGAVGFQCRVDADPYVNCTSPYQTAPLTNASHTFQVRAVDTAGNVDPSPDSEPFTVETMAPDTLIDSGPTGAPCPDPCFTTDATPTFSFHADRPNSTFECQLGPLGQTGSFTACTNPRTFTLTADGTYVFSVRAVGVGGTDQSPATKTFTLDRAAPQTTINSGPAHNSTLNTNVASFTFSSNEAGATFQCKLDAAAFAPCTSPVTYGPLSDGPHTFRVFAVDRAGNPDTSQQDLRTWTVDTVAPVASITGPTPAAPTDPNLTNSRTPSFTLTSSEGGTFECVVDPVGPTPAFVPCNANYKTATLADGSHVLHVRAKDAAGNLSAVTTKTFTVDATVPVLQFDATPTPISNNPEAIFQFSVKGDPTGTYTYQCKLDTEPDFTACTSPKTYTGLPDGQRNLQVRATDQAGNTSASVECNTQTFPTCTTYRWTIDTRLPQTQLGSRPRPVTNATTATFDFQSPNVTSPTFKCSRDGAAPTPCTSPQVYTGLTPGRHKFEVTAYNSAGTADPDPAVHEWTIDTTDPETTLGAAPPASTSSGFATFTFSSEAGAGFECRLDSSAWSACTSPKIYGELALGQHSFAVRAVDEAGNRDASPATRTWTVVAPPPPPIAVASGPSLINPFPVIRIAGTITRKGVRLRLFLVNAPAGSKIVVRCRGKKCPFSKKSRAAKALRLRTIEKRFYPAGVKIEVFVTKPGMIGKYTRFKIRKAKAPTRTDRCLMPGSNKPVRCTA